jgi:hypothetical protein
VGRGTEQLSVSDQSVVAVVPSRDGGRKHFLPATA